MIGPMPSAKRAMNPLTLVLGLSGVFFLIFVIISATFFFKKSPSKAGSHSSSSAFFGQGNVGVVELSGVITDSKKVIRQLEGFEEDESVKAIVLRLNSPGGSVAPSQEIYEAVKRIKIKKPVVASMSSVAASGAFYVACAATKVYANPGTITGSIGVIMEFVNLEKLYEWAKIKRYSIKTGKFKDAGAEYRDLTPEDRELLQGMVDDVLQQFKQAVSEGRKLSLEKVTAIADGRVLSGSQAKKANLVDQLGTFQDAVNDAAKMAKLKGKPNLVYPEHKSKRLLDFILEGTQDADSESTSSAGLIGALATHFLGSSAGLGNLRNLRNLEEQVTGVTPGIYWLWNGAR